MKIDVTDVSPVKKTMSVEIDPEAVEKETATVLRQYVKKARIPGFRPGRAPLEIVRTRFAKEVEEDVVERVVSRYHRQATKERGLEPLGDPVVEEVVHNQGEPLRFKTTFEVLPRLEVKDYKGVSVQRPSETLADSEVDEAIEELRQSRAQLSSVEGRDEARTGDVVVVDVEGTPDAGEPFRRERVMLEVGAAGNITEFNERLEGAAAGADLEFQVPYPEEFPDKNLAGTEVRYRLHVHEIKVRRVPELDDEFAKDLGSFESLEQLRGRVREDLAARKRAAANRAVQESILDKVLLENTVVLPDLLVEAEIRFRLQEIVRRMMAQGVDPEKAEIDWKALRKEQELPARKAVHARLVLDAVAKIESVEVDDDEVRDKIRQDAQRMGQTFEKMQKSLEQGDGVQALKNQMVREKTLDLLTSVANIQNED